MEPKLSPRHQEILRLAADGLTDKEIAATIGISRETVATHWKRIRNSFEASSRTAIIAQVIGSAPTEEDERSNELLRELEERDRLQAALAETNKTLQAELERRTAMLAQSRQDSDKVRSQTMKRLERLEELNTILTKAGIVPNRGEYGGSWRKLWVSDSIAAWGYTPEQALNGDITPMNTLVPEDIVHSLRGTEKVVRGQAKAVLSHRVICADGSHRVVLDLISAEPIGPDGIGQCTMIAVDLTDYVDEIRSLIERGWPDFPLRDE